MPTGPPEARVSTILPGADARARITRAWARVGSGTRVAFALGIAVASVAGVLLWIEAAITSRLLLRSSSS